jgi:hypothetical protein
MLVYRTPIYTAVICVALLCRPSQLVLMSDGIFGDESTLCLTWNS